MKKLLLIALLILSGNTDSIGQSVDWLNTIVSTSQNTYIKSNHIVSDKSGNVYAAGHFSNGTMDADPGPGVYTLTPSGISAEFFIVKTDANGNFIWAKAFGSCWHTNGIEDVAIDDSSNLYITGGYSGPMSVIVNGTQDSIVAAGGKDAYLIKLDSSGDGKWALSLGQAGDSATGFLKDDWGNSVFADPAGNIYVTGAFGNVIDADPGAGTSSIGSPNKWSAYLMKLSGAGNLIWAKEFTGKTGLVASEDVCVDPASNVFLSFTHYFADSVDCDPGAGTYYAPKITNNTAVICKLDSNGDFVWAKKPPHSNCHLLDVSAGDLIVSGNGYTVQLDNSGNNVWTTQIGNLGLRTISDQKGDLYSYGNFYGTYDFDPGAGTYMMSGNDTTDIFIQKMDHSGNFLWAVRIGPALIGSIGQQVVYDMVVDDSLDLFLTGYYSGKTDFEPGPDTFYSSNFWGGNYMLKLDSAWKNIPLNYAKASSQDLAIYPNPTSGMVHFDMEPRGPVTIRIMNTTGQLVKTFANIGENEGRIDLSSLPSGMYWIEIQHGQLSARAKVVKE